MGVTNLAMRILDELRTDLSYTLRTLRRDPGLVAGIIVTFALAIGANAAMFGLVQRLLLNAPPGVSDAERVVQAQFVYASDEGDRYAMSTTSYPAFLAMAATDRAFVAAAAVRSDTLALGAGADVTEVSAIEASGQYFSVLGARAAMGRFFDARDDALPAGNAVVVLSHAFWQRHFGGDPGVVGREIVLDDQQYTVIGVAPRDFTGHDVAPVDVFVPLTTALRGQGTNWQSDGTINLTSVIARFRDGVSPAAAQPFVTAAVRETVSRDRILAGVTFASLLRGSSARSSAQGRTMLWLSGVALAVLLIATANVGTLLLLRSLRRRREIAVRIALGVKRDRLARQLLTESLLLALAGGAVGLGVARWLEQLIHAVLLRGIAVPETFVDARVLLVTSIAACAAGLVAGCAPLVQLAQRGVIAELKEAAGTSNARRSALRSVLVGTQIALCTVLLVGAGLFVRSLERVQAQDLGFSTARLLFVSLDLHQPIPGPERDRLYDGLARRMTSVGGVTGATMVQAVPFGPHHIPPISVPGHADAPNVGGQLPMLYGATPEYLRMMGLKAREGRLFTDRDTRVAPLVVLVNETMARGVWPGRSAIGQCIRIGSDPALPAGPVAPPSLPCREVVGVVRDSRARSLPPEGSEAKLMQYYVPFDQLGGLSMSAEAPTADGLLVETSVDPERMIGPVQRFVQGATTTPVYARVRPYQELLDPQLRSWRLGAALFSAFGALALAIAAVGLFGVISYLVTERTREIGVRLALGGTGAHVGGLVVGDALRMAGTGVLTGIVVALVAAPLVQSMLFETSGRDVTVMAGAAGVLAAVAVLAAMVPAWRATRVSPMVALRAE